uniref:Uncharacterized protein n=1 Tax=Panagrolaimus sp. ES5 TaxID=591445 RepID=A0AC34FZK4_9BILA
MLHSSCNPNISFTDIIKNAPNIEDINVYDYYTNIIFEKTWMEDLVKYGKNLVSFTIKYDFKEFDVKNFIKFVEMKGKKKVGPKIQLNQDLLNEDEHGEFLYEINKQLLEYFDYRSNEDVWLQIGYDGVDGYSDFSLARIKNPKKLKCYKKKSLYVDIRFNYDLLDVDHACTLFDAITDELAKYFEYECINDLWLRIGFHGVD